MVIVRDIQYIKNRIVQYSLTKTFGLERRNKNMCVMNQIITNEKVELLNVELLKRGVT